MLIHDMQNRAFLKKVFDRFIFAESETLHALCKTCGKKVHKATLTGHSLFHKTQPSLEVPPEGKKSIKKTSLLRNHVESQTFETFQERPLSPFLSSSPEEINEIFLPVRRNSSSASESRKRGKMRVEFILLKSQKVICYFEKLSYHATRIKFLAFLRGFRKFKKLIKYEF
jgi:hypothetical protein